MKTAAPETAHEDRPPLPPICQFDLTRLRHALAAIADAFRRGLLSFILFELAAIIAGVILAIALVSAVS